MWPSCTAYGETQAADFVEACLNLAALPSHPVAPHDIDLYHTVATVRLSQAVSLGFEPPGRMSFSQPTWTG